MFRHATTTEHILDELLLLVRGDVELVTESVMKTSEIVYKRRWYWPFVKTKYYKVDFTKVVDYIIKHMKEEDERSSTDQLH